ncbi:hypothetical protein Tco_1284863 [Tanacetum coccineum]
MVISSSGLAGGDAGNGGYGICGNGDDSGGVVKARMLQVGQIARDQGAPPPLPQPCPSSSTSSSSSSQSADGNQLDPPRDPQSSPPAPPPDQLRNISCTRRQNKVQWGSLERDATTATGLDAEQDRGNINKTQSKATPNEPSSPGTSSGGGPRCQETMGDTIAQTRSENVSKLSNDPLLAKQTAQAQEITSLKLRVKKLEKKGGSRTHKLKRLYKVGRSTRIVSSDEASLGNQEDASKKGRKIDDI